LGLDARRPVLDDDDARLRAEKFLIGEVENSARCGFLQCGFLERIANGAVVGLESGAENSGLSRE
jgi:hypothetical protein